MRFKIDWATLIVGSKFTVFALFYFVFEGNFPSTSAPGPFIWRGDLTEGFLRYEFGGLIFGGAYFRNFAVFFFQTATDCNHRDFRNINSSMLQTFRLFFVVITVMKFQLFSFHDHWENKWWIC